MPALRIVGLMIPLACIAAPAAAHGFLAGGPVYLGPWLGFHTTGAYPSGYPTGYVAPTNPINHAGIENGYLPAREVGVTRRWVQLPVTNDKGLLVGYQQGYVWDNSFTGKRTGEFTFVRLSKAGKAYPTGVINRVPPGAGYASYRD